MRYTNVNQAVTNPQPAGTPAVLGKGVAQQDTERAVEALFFYWAGRCGMLHTATARDSQPFLYWQFSQMKWLNFVQNFLPEIAFGVLTKPDYRAYNRVRKRDKELTERRKKMKLVINKCYGGFGLSEDALAVLGVEYGDDVERSNGLLVEMVEANAKAVGESYSELEVVEIPDSATDYYIDEYDGFESVIYVVDGKLHWA